MKNYVTPGGYNKYRIVPPPYQLDITEKSPLSKPPQKYYDEIMEGLREPMPNVDYNEPNLPPKRTTSQEK